MLVGIKMIVEVGFKLDKKLKVYHNMLLKHGLKLVFKTQTHDLYFTKADCFDNLTENQIKNSCVRIRNPKDNKEETELLQSGYKKVFDTTKLDYHYANASMKSRIQLQQIEKLGLVAYYDNPDYYNYSLDKQRKCLIDELNSYGFNFDYDKLGIDKLRTLYYGKEMFSKNQNG